MAKKLENKVALITGGATGIGRSTSLLFASEGAKVVVADIQKKQGEETVSLILAGGGTALFVETDVTQSASAQNMVAKTVEHFGRLDIAHNNAGISGPRVACADIHEDDWDRVVDVNLKGVWLSLKYEVLQMLKNGGGAIVNTASIGGLVGIKRSAPYVVAKHGIIGLTKTAALEYVRKNIRINAVCPGMIDTPLLEEGIIGRSDSSSGLKMMVDSFKKDLVYSALKKQQPSGRMGTAEEVAKSVLWLCSEDASFITGHSLVVDGAYIAR